MPEDKPKVLRPELLTHIDKESKRGRPDRKEPVGWGMDYDKKTKQLHIFNDDGDVVKMKATEAMATMASTNTQEFIEKFYTDTVEEVQRRVKVRRDNHLKGDAGPRKTVTPVKDSK